MFSIIIGKSSHFASCFALFFLAKSFTFHCMLESMVIFDLSKFECFKKLETSADMDKQNV